jgi:hypothetical protein
MSIDPLTSGGTNSTGGARLDQPGSNQAARQAGQAQRPAGESREPENADDQVQLSDQAKAAGGAAGASPSGLSSERLQEILKRLTSGYYDSPPVVDRVAERVKDDLSGPGAA